MLKISHHCLFTDKPVAINIPIFFGYKQAYINFICIGCHLCCAKRQHEKTCSPFSALFSVVSRTAAKVTFFSDIMKTYLYNLDPLKAHFYTVKLGFTGVHTFFLMSAKNIDCGYSLDPPRRGGFNEYPQSMFWAEKIKKKKYQIFLSENFQFLGGEMFIIFE